MAEQEGVIKFELHHETADLPSGVDLTDLSHWRQELVRHGLVGRDPARYDGLGFGNLSQRLDIGGFVITGSQTGGLTKLAPEHFVWVSNVTTALNQVASQGRIYPSSEAITHATVYQASGEAMFVFHAHSPEIWAAGKALSLPATAFVPRSVYHERP
jgi:ribulose-5-phosphate 4-epimerase/fuculose-1-phosphate aldolase